LPLQLFSRSLSPIPTRLPSPTLPRFNGASARWVAPSPAGGGKGSSEAASARHGRGRRDRGTVRRRRGQGAPPRRGADLAAWRPAAPRHCGSRQVTRGLITSLFAKV
uniref:Uncharacterized protein n=1 Tax=Leersia perrieri TaxID=77586 RepID=A0A0D9VQD0_9ORYZ